MSYPIVEQIAQAIATKLATITTDNGYEVDVAAVIRPTAFGLSAAPAHLSIVMAQGDEDREDLDATGNPPLIAMRQPFQLALVIRLSDDSSDSFDTIANAFTADVIKAMFADRQWSNLAIDTELAGLNLLKDEQVGYEGKLVQFDVIYRVAEDDPYSQS